MTSNTNHAARSECWRWPMAMLAATVMALASGAAHAATVVIDDFTVVQSPNSPWLAASPNNLNGLDGLDLTPSLSFANPIPPNAAVGGAYTETGLDPAHVLGGSRRSELTVTASSPPAPEFEIAMINVLPGGTGIFFFETGLTVIGNSSLIYDGTLGAGAPNGTMFVRFNDYDFEDEQPLLVRLAIDDGNGGVGQIDRQLNQVVDLGNSFDLPLPLGDGEFAGVDFGGPVNLKFTFFGNLADDFGLEQITFEGTEVVAEPSSLALGALGLVGLGAWGFARRRRSKERVATDSACFGKTPNTESVN